MERKQYVLIDLERSIKSSMVHYWKKNQRGYTMTPGEAGKYEEAQAAEIVAGDLDRVTIAIEFNKLTALLGVH
jgi:hypothetical protein